MVMGLVWDGNLCVGQSIEHRLASYLIFVRSPSFMARWFLQLSRCVLHHYQNADLKELRNVESVGNF